MRNHIKMRDHITATNTASGIVYRHGGNPPVAAGIFDSHGERLVWWPAEYEPSQDSIDLVVRELVWRRNDETPVSRSAVRSLLKASEKR